VSIGRAQCVFAGSSSSVRQSSSAVWSKLPEPQRWQIVTYLQALDVAP